MVTLHFIHPKEGGAIKSEPIFGSDGTTISRGGEFHVACKPDGFFALGQHCRATGEAWLVNCAECKKTEAYQKADKTNPTISASGLASPVVDLLK